MTSFPSRKRAGVAAALVVAVLAAIGSGSAKAASTWPQPAHDGAMSSYNPGETVLKPGNVGRLHRLGSVRLGNLAVGMATLGGAAAFTCDDLGFLTSTSTRTGGQRWTTSGVSGYCSAAALGGSSAYTTAWRLNGSTFVNSLTAFDAASGSQRWQVKGPPDRAGGPSWLTFNMPTLAGGGLYVTSGRSLVSAYDATSGDLRWRAETGYLNNQAAVADGLVFTSTWGLEGGATNALFAHRVADGSLAWSRPTDSSNTEYPAVAAGGRVFVSSDSGYVRAFDTATGTPQWGVKYSYISANLVATPDTVYAVATNSLLIALNTADGTSRWTLALSGTDRVSSNLVVAGDVLYCLVQDFGGTVHLAAFDARNGNALLRLDDTLSGDFGQVSVADGRVYVALRGELRAYGR